MALNPNDSRLNRFIGRLERLTDDPCERDVLSRAIRALDNSHDLKRKIAQEPGVEQIITQMVERIIAAFGRLSAAGGMKVLDIACGSNTSKAPGLFPAKGYTAQFEPWMCRILSELGAEPVGVDIGNLDHESFTHFRVDLGTMGSLDMLPGHSFDAVQDSRLFGSPEFNAQFPDYADHLRIAREIRRQERRLLKPGGIIIHSDARDLVG